MHLVTRADWDGLVCAVLLGLVEPIENVFFSHPKDMQDRKVRIPKGATVANLPYHPDCGLWFDHHISEQPVAEALGDKLKGRFALAPSTARLIYVYYGRAMFPGREALVEATDRIDSAQLSMEDVIKPSGYVLLSYTIDPRTGLPGQYQPYFLKLAGLLRDQPLDQVLQEPEVKARCDQVIAEDARFRRALMINSHQEGNVVITDFRGLGEVPPGNRFMIYALFPEANISMRLFDGRGGRTTIVSLGHSLFRRTSRTNIGELLSRYGGGGHIGAGTAQFPRPEADARIAEILAAIQET